MNYALI